MALSVRELADKVMEKIRGSNYTYPHALNSVLKAHREQLEAESMRPSAEDMDIIREQVKKHLSHRSVSRRRKQKKIREAVKKELDARTRERRNMEAVLVALQRRDQLLEDD